MNPETHKIIEEMEKLRADGSAYNAMMNPTQQSALMARLMVLLAEEQEKSAAKMERQTEKIIRLTWGLFWLTLALAFVAAIQLYVMLK